MLLLASCTKEKFTVNGEITAAADSMLYFEHWSLEGPVTLDSVKLDKDGKFEFKADACHAVDSIKNVNYYPEFYRLRIADQIINISADSTETVTVQAKYPDMAWKYEVKADNGSENCQKIYELTQRQIALQNACIRVTQTQELSAQEANDSIEHLIAAHKQGIKLDYIVNAPMKPYAYFALFQAVGNRLIFNPRADREDVRMFAAVATSWDTYYPGSERGLNLHNIAVEGMKTQRILASQNASLEVDASKVKVTNFIDVSLPDNTGNTRSLSQLIGKVILVDFHAFSQEGSMEYIMRLRDIYNKYHAGGLEIYMVGVDSNEHFWKTNVKALPWVNVYDPAGSSLQTYNVQSLPSGYILNREGSAVLRYETLDGLEAEIQKHM